MWCLLVPVQVLLFFTVAHHELYPHGGDALLVVFFFSLCVRCVVTWWLVLCSHPSIWVLSCSEHSFATASCSQSFPEFTWTWSVARKTGLVGLEGFSSSVDRLQPSLLSPGWFSPYIMHCLYSLCSHRYGLVELHVLMQKLYLSQLLMLSARNTRRFVSSPLLLILLARLSGWYWGSFVVPGWCNYLGPPESSFPPTRRIRPFTAM